jgi:hypothetical protein
MPSAETNLSFGKAAGSIDDSAPLVLGEHPTWLAGPTDQDREQMS